MSRPILVAVAAGALCACYSPTLIDCVVACGLPGDCGDGQVCGTDGLCAAPEVASTCKSGGNPAQPDAPGTTATPDAPPTMIQDAPPTTIQDAPADAAPTPDASPSVTLRLVVLGRGTVSVPGVGTCGSGAQNSADCSWLVALGSQQQVVVSPNDFDKWQSANCMGQGATCTLTASTSPTLVKVKLQQMD